MNLCANGHDEVCYEGYKCPACEVADDLNQDISKLEDRISALENQIGELEGTIEDLEQEAKERSI
jgi:chaperonin cofactor prefoldin